MAEKVKSKKNNIIMIVAIALIAVLLVGYFAFIYEPYVPDTGYTAVDPGELPAKIDGFDYEKAGLERYDEEVVITVGAINYPLEEGVKVGTSPETQSFNRLAKDVLKLCTQRSLKNSASTLRISPGFITEMGRLLRSILAHNY